MKTICNWEVLGGEVCITAVLLLTVTGVCISSPQRFLPALHLLMLWMSTRMECKWSGNLWKPTFPSITLSSARVKVKWQCALTPCRGHPSWCALLTSWAFHFCSNPVCFSALQLTVRNEIIQIPFSHPEVRPCAGCTSLGICMLT